MFNNRKNQIPAFDNYNIPSRDEVLLKTTHCDQLQCLVKVRLHCVNKLLHDNIWEHCPLMAPHT